MATFHTGLSTTLSRNLLIGVRKGTFCGSILNIETLAQLCCWLLQKMKRGSDDWKGKGREYQDVEEWLLFVIVVCCLLLCCVFQLPGWNWSFSLVCVVAIDRMVELIGECTSEGAVLTCRWMRGYCSLGRQEVHATEDEALKASRLHVSIISTCSSISLGDKGVILKVALKSARFAQTPFVRTPTLPSQVWLESFVTASNWCWNRWQVASVDTQRRTFYSPIGKARDCLLVAR